MSIQTWRAKIVRSLAGLKVHYVRQMNPTNKGYRRLDVAPREVAEFLGAEKKPSGWVMPYTYEKLMEFCASPTGGIKPAPRKPNCYDFDVHVKAQEPVFSDELNPLSEMKYVIAANDNEIVAIDFCIHNGRFQCTAVFDNEHNHSTDTLCKDESSITDALSCAGRVVSHAFTCVYQWISDGAEDTVGDAERHENHQRLLADVKKLVKEYKAK